MLRLNFHTKTVQPPVLNITRAAIDRNKFAAVNDEGRLYVARVCLFVTCILYMSTRCLHCLNRVCTSYVRVCVSVVCLRSLPRWFWDVEHDSSSDAAGVAPRMWLMGQGAAVSAQYSCAAVCSAGKGHPPRMAIGTRQGVIQVRGVVNL